MPRGSAPAPVATDAVSRRRLLTLACDILTLVGLSGARFPAAARENRWATDPFTLGVASGDPWPTGVVLWTHLDAVALAEAGQGHAPVRVGWEVAEDDRFRHVVRRGVAMASSARGHSVHAEVDGLRPDRHYWYRFSTGAVTSPVGRTRTAPSSVVDRFVFAFTSCQNYENGLYTSHGHLANEDLRLVVHLGDYIYEGGVGARGPRHHDSPEIHTLEEYRARYRLYKSDPQLQAAHAACPWVVAWDDHEVSNDYAGPTNGAGLSEEQFLARRAAAYEAYYEFLPLRRASLPSGPHAQLYRRLGCGPLVQFHLLDTRQYRSAQACTRDRAVARGLKIRCPEGDDPTRTMLGVVQERWLERGLKASPAQWNILANQVMMGEAMLLQRGVATYSMDAWDGYPDARARLVRMLDSVHPSNPVVITGDAHSNWVHELKGADDPSPTARTVAPEFVGTSLSSGGDGDDSTGDKFRAANPCLSYYSNRRGYARATVTPASCTVEYRVVPYVSRPGAPIQTDASFVVRNGIGGLSRTD